MFQFNPRGTSIIYLPNANGENKQKWKKYI